MNNNNLLLLFFTLTVCSSLVWAETDTGADVQAFIPKDWKILSKVQGDLNGDQQADMVLIIENTDPINIVKNKFNQKKPANLLVNQNERKLLVLFKDAQTYRLITSTQELDRKNTPKISWSKLKKAPLPKLEQINFERYVQ